MIKTFADADTKELFETGRTRKFRPIEKAAKRKLDYIDEAKLLDHLKVPPGNKLHRLEKDRSGQHAIWINEQYRVCFVWKQDLPTEGNAYDVEVTDYH